MKRRIVMVSVFLFLITIYGLRFTPYEIYAQHEEQHKAQGAQKKEAPKKQAPDKLVYYCPMHPGFTSDKPGDCAICGMKLVKKAEAEAIEKEAKAPQDICVLHNCPMLGQGKNCPMVISGNVSDCPYCGAHLKEGEKGAGFYISPEKQQLIGVRTEKIISRPLAKVVRTVGRVVFDPELYKAQQEYIEAAKTLEKVKESGEEGIISRSQALINAASLKLTLSGLSPEQIKELAEKKENDQSLLVSSLDSPAGWVYAVIYEYELEWVKIGQEASITAISYPGKAFTGKVVAIDPVFDSATRSVRARIKVDNKDGLLKPNMYVDVQMFSDLGKHLSVPNEAVMDSGLRKIVFLSLDGGRFKPVEIKAGVSTEEYVQVLEGLKEGDTVVVSGNFLIDSESKLKSALESTGHKPEGDGLASSSQTHKPEGDGLASSSQTHKHGQ